MSSVVHDTVLTSDNLTMLCRVLDAAGIRDIDTDWDRQRRMRYGRMLIDAFQDRQGSEAELAVWLLACVKADEVPRARIQLHRDSDSDLIRWETDGGRPPRSRARGSYLYGKRIELDGTWTIHHVFSGDPAQYGTWNMTGLSKPVADRALRTINSPQPIGEPT